MSDLISREAEINTVFSMLCKWDTEDPEDLKNMLLLAFQEIPSAHPERWIPVSERLPEESDGTVLVCMPNKFPYNEKEPFVNAKHNRQVETATYSQYSDTWHYTNGGVKSTRPIAWMPLPEPWKGEEDG